MRIIRTGDAGEDVRDVQHRLVAAGYAIDSAELDGRFGTSTDAAVRGFQQRRKLPVDGLVGPDTWAQLVEAGWSLGDRVLYLRYPFLRGDDVRALQRLLNSLGFDAGREDGILGRATDRAIREFQRNVGQDIDGIVGPDTVTGLLRLRPDDTAPSRAVVREAESLRAMHGQLTGAVIAIDPSDDETAPPGAAAIALALARALERELAGRGCAPLLLRDERTSPTSSERAEAANDAKALACIGIQVGELAGARCAFFGTESTYSPAGERLAQLIQERLCGLGFEDLGTERLAVSMLRETRMPAVQIQTGSIGTPQGERQLADPASQRDVARAVAGGLERFLSAPIEPAL